MCPGCESCGAPFGLNLSYVLQGPCIQSVSGSLQNDNAAKPKPESITAASVWNAAAGTHLLKISDGELPGVHGFRHVRA